MHPLRLEVNLSTAATTAKPSLSVVLVSRQDAAGMSAAVERLRAACREMQVELVVVRALRPGELARVPPGADGVRLIAAPPEASVADLRRLGMTEAAGDIVAFTEETGALALDWTELFLRWTGELAGALPPPGTATDPAGRRGGLT
ncbi:MAG TPA: hypothetical protein VNI61_07685 [Gemmatimonadales bacterium]|nr:hypothetical protein [Gemmatimonadales bacterium]